jgi:VanZ family protein
MMSDALAEQPLRCQRLWQAVGLVLVAFVIDMSLTPNPLSLPGEHGDKYGHVLAYAALMFWFAQLHGGIAARAGWALTFAAMGVGLEFVQGLTDYRTFEVQDMLADSLGVLAGWIAAPPRSPHVIRAIEARWPSRP